MTIEPDMNNMARDRYRNGFRNPSLGLQCTIMLLMLGVTSFLPAQAQTTLPSQGDQQASTPPPVQPGAFPIDIAGYLSFQSLRDNDLQNTKVFREYSGSLFLSKNLNRWRFHLELNVNTLPAMDNNGLFLLPQRHSLGVRLDSGFVNYVSSDALQISAGYLFIPTYWREHRYQSTTLTVDNPLLDENVFPTAFKGGMIHGDKYFDDWGVSYALYGGVDQQTEFTGPNRSLLTEGARCVGVKVTAHLPSAHFFDTFDVAFQELGRYPSDGGRDDVYGTEFLLRKQRVEVLSEFAHDSLDIVGGSRAYIREGVYVQPSYRIAKKWFGVMRYDRLDADSRMATESNQSRQSAGVTFHPIPSISLKLEGDRYSAQSRERAHYGITAGAVIFFHKP